MINHKFNLEKYFPQILYKIDINGLTKINEASGLIVESIDSQYINNSTFRPLSESSANYLLN